MRSHFRSLMVIQVSYRYTWIGRKHLLQIESEHKTTIFNWTFIVPRWFLTAVLWTLAHALLYIHHRPVRLSLLGDGSERSMSGINKERVGVDSIAGMCTVHGFNTSPPAQSFTILFLNGLVLLWYYDKTNQRMKHLINSNIVKMPVPLILYQTKQLLHQ